MKPLEIHWEADQEVIAAEAYYDARQPGLGAEFEREFRAAAHRLQGQPLTYAVVVGRFRQCVLTRFPYGIFYADLRDRIWIAAVAHHRRGPNYWRHRRPTP